LPTLTLNLSIEIKPIAIPISYIVLIFIYVAMGKYVEPKIIKFYATKGLVSKKYAYPIVSLLFASLACSIYLTIATLFISFFVFQHESTQIEITVSYLVFSFIFLGLGYFLFLRRNKIIKIKNPFK
jgi:hypothetical protein